MLERSIAVTTHGRYLVDPRSNSAGRPLLVSFHGYAEPAEAALARVAAIPGADEWVLVAVQGLHRFYRGRSDDVVASWMTRQARDSAIADNIDYVQRVVASVEDEWHTDGRVVYAGFSQGVAMAFRAATAARRGAAVVACCGDVPPELGADVLGGIDRALLGRGERDGWYTTAKLEADLSRLRAAAVRTDCATFDGDHEWPPSFSEVAGGFLRSLQ
jgi:poly(3-hydroxybutyrate) depolymerase